MTSICAAELSRYAGLVSWFGVWNVRRPPRPRRSIRGDSRRGAGKLTHRRARGRRRADSATCRPWRPPWLCRVVHGCPLACLRSRRPSALAPCASVRASAPETAIRNAARRQPKPPLAARPTTARPAATASRLTAATAVDSGGVRARDRACSWRPRRGRRRVAVRDRRVAEDRRSELAVQARPPCAAASASRVFAGGSCSPVAR